MSQEKFWVLLSKKLSGEASVAELQELQDLIHEHPEWQYAIQNLEDLWKVKASIPDKLAEEDAYLLHLHRMKSMNISFDDTPGTVFNRRPGQSGRRNWYWAAAAVLVLALGYFSVIGLFGKGPRETAGNQANEVSTRQGSKSRVQLPDGSVVRLNAGSKLVYNKNFGQETREVSLTGEGYFEVTHLKEKPFIIHTCNMDIKVLGTIFNVKAYPEDKQTETSLIRGSIEVTIKNRPANKIILSPSEKLVVENQPDLKTANNTEKDLPQPAISINKLKYNHADSTVAEIQWIENKLVFNDESFSDLAQQMERWYDVRIEITDPGLLQKRLTGNFEKETVQQALEALKISIPFEYEQAGNKIIIHR